MVETFSREFKPLSESDKRMILSMASTNPGQAMAILRDKVNEGLRTKVSVLRDYLPLAGQSPIYNTHFKTVVSDLSHLMDSPSLFVRSSVVTFLESQEGRLLLENSPELQQKYDATRKDLLDTFTKYGDKVRNPDDPVTQWRFEDNPKSVYSFFLGNWVGIPEALELRIATTTPLSKIPGLENYAQFKQDIKEIKEGLATIESVKDKNERKKLIKQLDAEARKYGSSYKNVKADIRRIEELEDTYYNTANDDERNKALNELMQIYQGYLQTQGTAQDITQQQKTPTPGSAGQGSGGGSTPRMSPN
jgi:hypothetical protein